MPETGSARAEWRAGWRTVLAAGIGTSTGLILYSYITSLFVKPMSMEFGWTRGETSMAGMATLAAGLLAPFVGRLVDRFGIRPMIVVGGLGFGAACAGYTVQNGDVRMYYALVFLVVLFGLGTTSITWSRAVSAAFTRSRGLALSAALSVVTLTAAIMPLALNEVMTAQGWRAGWLVVGGVGFVFALVGLAVLPAKAAQVVTGSDAARPRQGLGGALRSPAFWCLVLGMFVINIPSGGLMNQMAALISDKGFDGRATASVLSAFAISVALGRLISGVCLDRFPPPLVAFVSMALPAAGCLLLLGQEAALVAAITGIALAGMSQGAEGDIGPYLVGRYFGLASFGAIMGCVNAAVVSGTAFGGMLFGRAYDVYGSYDAALWAGAGCFLFGAALFLGLGLGGGLGSSRDGRTDAQAVDTTSSRIGF